MYSQTSLKASDSDISLSSVPKQLASASDIITWLGTLSVLSDEGSTLPFDLFRDDSSANIKFYTINQGKILVKLQNTSLSIHIPLFTYLLAQVGWYVWQATYSS